MHKKKGFSDESKIFIDYGRKIAQIQKIFRNERTDFFDLFKDSIKKDKTLAIKISFKKKEKKEENWQLPFSLELKNKLFSNPKKKPAIIGFTKAGGQSTKAEIDPDKDEDHNSTNIINRPALDYFIKIPIINRQDKKDITNKEYEKEILSKFKEKLHENDTKRKGRFFVISFKKDILFKNFDKIVKETMAVLKYFIKIVDKNE